MERPPVRRIARPILDFLSTEAGGGVILLAAAVVALVWANSPWASLYERLGEAGIELAWGPISLPPDVHHWVNEGLMALFFFVVGLEIKRELATGELREPRKAALPILAAAGGMAVPAALYLVFAGSPETRVGWGIPVATDIAFAVGVLALFSSRVPLALKTFVLTLAIADDVGGIVVIALFYSHDLSLWWLVVTAGALATVVLMYKAGITQPLWYLPVALVAWLAEYQSGVHATIAGVALGLVIPAHPVAGRPVLEELEHALHPWSSYVAVPLFGLLNAGVRLDRESVEAVVQSPVGWGVIAGLLVGKPVGIVAASLLGLALRVGRLPEDMGVRHVIVAGVLCGIGFTISLFIAGLAFRASADILEVAKIAILAASLAAGAAGAGLIVWLLPRSASAPEEPEEAQA